MTVKLSICRAGRNVKRLDSHKGYALSAYPSGVYVSPIPVGRHTPSSTLPLALGSPRSRYRDHVISATHPVHLSGVVLKQWLAVDVGRGSEGLEHARPLPPIIALLVRVGIGPSGDVARRHGLPCLAKRPHAGRGRQILHELDHPSHLVGAHEPSYLVQGWHATSDDLGGGSEVGVHLVEQTAHERFLSGELLLLGIAAYAVVVRVVAVPLATDDVERSHATVLALQHALGCATAAGSRLEALRAESAAVPTSLGALVNVLGHWEASCDRSSHSYFVVAECRNSTTSPSAMT